MMSNPDTRLENPPKIEQDLCSSEVADFLVPVFRHQFLFVLFVSILDN